jgi:hypothetical protein
MVPQALRDRPQWLIWKFEKKAGQEKLAKMPYYVDGGRRHGKQGSDEDRKRLVSYGAAVAASPPEGKGGIGFAFLPGDGLIGIDLDGMIDGETGEISERGRNIIKACDSFTEYSPSGKGVHIYVKGDTSSVLGKRGSFKSNEVGVEVFCGAQFFTVTGRHYAGTPETANAIPELVLRRLLVTVRGKKPKSASSPEAPPAPAKLENDFARINDAAIRNLPAWVPSLFPSARAYQDGYRIAQRDLGRDLQEDLSIMPQGIVDFGVADMGDPREGKRTPIDLVVEWGRKKPKDALHWLAERLGIALERKASRTRAPDKGAGSSGKPPAEAGGEGGDPDDDRPVIKWTQGKLPECVDQAEDALLKSGLRIYQRAGFLVRVIKRDQPSVRHYKRRAPGALGIVGIEQAHLIEQLTRAARWLKFSSQKGAWVPSNAPEQAAATYMARRGHWQVPRLWSAISTPTLRPDGTLLQEPGYDVDSQTWYDPLGIDFPKIPDAPSKEEAERALRKFREAFDSFPFESRTDMSVALALALTALVRRSLPSAPLGGITAPQAGTGKTLLVDSIAIMATGVSAPAIKYADTDEEFTKTMLAILAEGDQVVLIDNVERPLDNETLNVVLTSESFRQRMLGKTEMMTVPTTTLFMANGNHLTIAGDTSTRTLMCRMDAKTEHPEQRQFEIEKREWITQHRPELVAAGLTIMRAFIATKQRVQDYCETWGRFERWTDMVRAPLIWLDCADPCDSLKQIEHEDPARNELLRVITAWETCFGEEPYTAGEAIETAVRSRSDPAPVRAPGADALDLVLRDICKDRDGALNPKRLAHWLRKHENRIVSDSGKPRDGEAPRKPMPPKRLVRKGSKDHTHLWKVETMNPS